MFVRTLIIFHLAMAASALRLVVVGATGGLGQALVREALGRGHTVSVLVRDRKKLDEVLGAEAVSRLSSVHVGDAHDAAVTGAAVAGQEIVFGAQGADQVFARVVAEQSKAAGARKFVFVAGATNVMSEDGTTPNYIAYMKEWSFAESAFKAHGACIDAIRATGVPHVIFCPGFMQAVGKRSDGLPEAANIRVNRPSGNFVSFEDAAWVMLQAAEGPQWDGQLITASTKRSSESAAGSEL
jgi:uncharacterized protein YbjT (DUF2867 family)